MAREYQDIETRSEMRKGDAKEVEYDGCRDIGITRNEVGPPVADGVKIRRENYFVNV